MLDPLLAAHSLFRSYVALQFPRYVFGRHHLLICDALERVERGECKRLMIFMPPRHGKSMLVSEFFPAWYLGRNPSHSVIASSYALELAEDFGRKVRNQLRDPIWHRVFPHASLDTSSASSTKISTNEGGNYYAVGVGGATTGRGAHLLLIDDPVKGREDADSETIRRKVKDWYRSVAYTRLMKGGAVIVVLTRWHEDDLAGWALDEQGHEGWEVLSLPAIAEEQDVLGRKPGEALWPEFFPVERLETIRQTVGPREWISLYQQRPAPEEGAYFQRSWFKFYDELPERLRFYGASDYAVTADGGDYTVHLVVGVSESDDLYIVDMWRGQTDALEWVENLLEMFRAYKPQIWAEEGGVILKSLDSIIRKRLLEERLFTTLRRQFSSASDKPSRARSLQARMQMCKVYFPSPARCPWMADLIAEFLTFPQGKHDDQVDAASLLCRMLDVMQAPQPAKVEPTLGQRVQAITSKKPTFNDLLQQSRKQREVRPGW